MVLYLEEFQHNSKAADADSGTSWGGGFVESEFHKFLVSLKEAHRPARTFVDDRHTVLTRTNFRPAMRRLTMVVTCVDVRIIL